MERLREHLQIDKWLVLGASWGSTLSLVYAEGYPERVTEMVLFGVTTGQHKEFDWTFRGGLGLLYPTAWQRLCDAVGSRDPAKACQTLLFDTDSRVREEAALEWCLWESSESGRLEPRFRDPRHRLAFARIVTRYASNYAWLRDGEVLQGIERLHDIPAALINGRHDLQAVFGAWELNRIWPSSELIVVDDSGHVPSDALENQVVAALDRFGVDHSA
jgi:proline iminopeptidase